MDDIIKTTDFEYGILCPVCRGEIDYVCNLDTTKEFDGNRVKAEEAYVLLDEDGYHTTEGHRLVAEFVIACPSCKTKIKTKHGVGFVD